MPTPEGADLRGWLFGRLTELASGFVGVIHDTMPLAEDGLGLDSMRLIELVSAIEEHLGVGVREDEITPEHFGTVGRLLSFLEERRT